MFELTDLREDLSDAIDGSLQTAHVFDFDLDPIKDRKEAEDFSVSHLVVHAVDSSNFSERVNRESQENLSFRKCLKINDLAQARGPHCKSYNGLQVLHSPVGECEILRRIPQSGVDIHQLRDIANLPRLSAHSVEPDSALRDVFL